MVAVHFLTPHGPLCLDRAAAMGTYDRAAVTCPACMRRLGHLPESALLAEIRRLASAHSWLSYHTHRSDRSEKGWFDLALARPGCPLLLAELKTATGKLTPEQDRWVQAVQHATGVQAYVWRPADLPLIRALLEGGEHTP